MVLENIPRIAAPAPEVLLREWILPRRPVILTDLYDAAPIRRIDTIEKAKAALGHVEVEVQPNYLTFLQTGEPLRAVLPPPACSELGDQKDVVSATFLANAGNFNHLHFDDDQRGVLLYEVFGTKRFSLISPAEWRKLNAFLVFDGGIRRALSSIPARDANGRVFFQDFPSEAAREAFLRYVGASDCLLHPGETLFMPALAWHYVEYVDTSLSITYRLGRNAWNRALGTLFPQPTIFVQTVGERLVDEERFFADFPGLGTELRDVLTAPYETADRQADAVHAFLMRAFEVLFGESAAAVAAAREIYRLSLSG